MKINIGNYPNKGNNRKVNIHIDEYDTWNLDSTLATIIYPALIQLKTMKHGIPSEFGDVGGEDHNMQDSFDFYKESYNEAWKDGVARWDEIMDKMIWSFEQLIKGYDDQYHHGEMKYDWIKTDKSILNPLTGKVEETFQMLDNNPKEHWYDSVGHKLHEDRVQEGLDLFGKYYRSLWD